jgi:hypothetical protein
LELPSPLAAFKIHDKKGVYGAMRLTWCYAQVYAVIRHTSGQAK